jgi:hypothetical protein
MFPQWKFALYESAKMWSHAHIVGHEFLALLRTIIDDRPHRKEGKSNTNKQNTKKIKN